MTRGTLIVNAGGQIRIKFTNKNGKHVEMAVPRAQLSQDLMMLQPQKLNNLEVEFDEEQGQPRRVRVVGQTFIPPSGHFPSIIQHLPSQQKTPSGAAPMTTKSSPHGLQQPRFHNPYNFIPAPPRPTKHSDLGDHLPDGHHVLLPDHYTGTIRVKMKVITPLLVLDAARAVEVGNGHKSYPVRLDCHGMPYIPPTSIKGMLRSALEALTNSRFPIFAGHDQPLAYRMTSRQGLALIPAVVQDGQLQLMTGTSQISASGPKGPMYAAWLHAYPLGKPLRKLLKYPNGSPPAHGDHVEAWLELWEHRTAHFQYWAVVAIAKVGQNLGAQPSASPLPQNPSAKHAPVPNTPMIKVKGYLCINNHNINRKHDERLFFVSPPNPITVPITAHHRAYWKNLITNYQQEHTLDLAKGLKGPPAMSGVVWSRHIVGVNHTPQSRQAETELKNGTLCYVDYDPAKNTVRALYPVCISRALYSASPLDLLHPTLKPATKLDDLSPADRLFGWVNQQGQGAYKGHLRIGPVSCISKDPLERFGNPGLSLAILAAPKPQQARFYVAKSPRGEAQPSNISKEQAGYSQDKGLRGRKVYPHHAQLRPGYWDNPLEDRTQQNMNGIYQEYRRPTLHGQEQRDDQNRSIQGWIKPKTEFVFTIHVMNFSKVELGALLYLLTLPDEHYLRLGGGKPFGFGSVRLDLDHGGLDLACGSCWATRYTQLGSHQDTIDVGTPVTAYDASTSDQHDDGDDDVHCAPINIEDFINAFVRSLSEAYSREAKSPPNAMAIPFLAAFLRSTQGFQDGLPTRYPRCTPHPDPEGKSYEWFVANEKISNKQNRGKFSLPDLTQDRGLPLDPTL
ncbi:MAG: hypothetical protein KatS3mg113_1050 [Planctomycetaceae bacterium]|nr:MAG: hypothetical protein KatS3mg113_1050 [Planctomycetaceae bacterium]